MWYYNRTTIANYGSVVIAKSITNIPTIQKPVVLKVINQLKSHKSFQHELMQEIEIYRYLQNHQGLFILSIDKRI